MRYTAQVQRLRAAVASTLAGEVGVRSPRRAEPAREIASPIVPPAAAAVRPIKIISGWVEEAFWLAIVLSAITLVVLFLTYSSGRTPLTALERLSWVAAPLGFGFFVFFARWQVPAALASVRERRLLGDDESDYSDVFGKFESRLNSNLSLLLALGISAPVLAGYLAVPHLMGEGTRPDGGWTAAELLEVSVATLIAGIAGLGLWRMYAIGRFVSDLGNRPTLRVHLHHPDGCGGFEPLGRVCLDNVLVLAIPAALLAFGVVQGVFMQDRKVPLPVHIGLLVTVIVTASLAFVLPMLSIRRAMKSKAADVLASLELKGEAIDALAEDIVKAAPSRPTKKLRKGAKKLKLLREVYQRESQVPTWPIRFRGAVTFAASQAVPILALLVSFAQLFTQ